MTLRYRTIVADPPWEIEAFPKWFGSGEKGVTPTPYSFMSLEEICALPVKNLADNRDGDAHLYLWTITEYLPQAYDVARAWGFEPMAVLVWCKPPRGLGLGGIFAANVEFVLFCRRSGFTSVDTRAPRPDIAEVTSRIGELVREAGFTTADVNEWVGASDIASWWMSPLPLRCAIPKPGHWETIKGHVPALAALDTRVAEFNAEKGKDRKPPRPLEERVDSRWFVWPRGRHSEKPEAFFDLVERVSPGPYLELFARRQRLGWDTWGNEALCHVELCDTETAA